ncbi:hypothetical protein EJ04DRAFT_142821 [Polyplosphaeria fusca]|uniref:Uncharacterized protein n=1 Tax=Polyplosphaeria fusca TaxID=682080 RepID=A0A9P4V525_9PLEO|nr:hypothetical protein EJ04DRAFT_142821 [Polyplosphaeria fusca]
MPISTSRFIKRQCRPADILQADRVNPTFRVNSRIFPPVSWHWHRIRPHHYVGRICIPLTPMWEREPGTETDASLETATPTCTTTVGSYISLHIQDRATTAARTLGASARLIRPLPLESGRFEITTGPCQAAELSEHDLKRLRTLKDAAELE